MHRLVASGLGLGFIPSKLWGSDRGAGTFGAGLGAVIGLVLLPAPWWGGAVAALVAIGVSLWAARPFAAAGEDPQWVVIDEVAGTLVALVGLAGWPWVLALVVARLLDIYKGAPGVGASERLPGAIGITADDVVAGAYGLAVGWVATAL